MGLTFYGDNVKTKYETIELDEDCFQYCKACGEILNINAEKFANYALGCAILEAKKDKDNITPSEKKNIDSIKRRIKKMNISISDKQQKQIDKIRKKSIREEITCLYKK